MHLTNYAINKKSENFEFNEDADEEPLDLNLNLDSNLDPNPDPKGRYGFQKEPELGAGLARRQWL